MRRVLCLPHPDGSVYKIHGRWEGLYFVSPTLGPVARRVKPRSHKIVVMIQSLFGHDSSKGYIKREKH